MRITTILATLVAAASLAAISACSGSDSNAASFNDADVTFAQDMIPHHRQAAEMAKLAAGRTENPQVLDLADQITAAQQPEIDEMSRWLKSWGKKVPSDTSGMGEMKGMDHGSSSDMPGMMSADEMASLEAASGAEFDRQFLTMMTAHHEGAIEMARSEEAHGRSDDAVALAEKIHEDQAAEVTTMQGLLGS
jgi:uncharacterized protein (DUF305 family)